MMAVESPPSVEPDGGDVPGCPDLGVGYTGPAGPYVCPGGAGYTGPAGPYVCPGGAGYTGPDGGWSEPWGDAG
ncbi:hypothetical protein CA850_06210 [Micromonospora echinospora]|nr:hypothetical protein CA850_06210 [Micromonospora echinospora]